MGYVPRDISHLLEDMMARGFTEPKEKGTIVQTFYLENTEEGHSKFYEIKKWQVLRPESYTTVFHLSVCWGRIGSLGTTMWERVNDSYDDAINVIIRDRLYEKRSKGYKEVSKAKVVDTPRDPPKESKKDDNSIPLRFKRVLGGN